ncbi:ion transport protein [Theileria orientalis strain Shintoku]|uniref:Ion transport protein n=1 Tax=Theileria orientalis strain Shintoku TaxID=869250 RepID=J4CCT9_THEOR|nr:ion transport protein [Theileria orientalis strain Shintoku]BAM39972.1 ion transport protein [Theileria orientalis strain Shintoku]|eukprot:XP_009690273.1 ion transport protein [Theileria orientalis strain Shintoku]
MNTSRYLRVLSVIDEVLGLLVVIFIAFSAVRQCIRLPLSPLFSIAIVSSLTLVSFFLLNFNKIIFFVNKYVTLSYKSKGQLYNNSQINKRRRTSGNLKKNLEKDAKTSAIGSEKNLFFKVLRRHKIWFSLHLVRKVLLSKIWVVSSLLLTLTWFAVWEWAALYMTRDDGDYNLLHWNMERVPYQYWYLESAFQIIFAVTYILNLYEAGSRIKYIFSFFGMIELTMTPVITEIISIVTYYNPQLVSDRNESLHNFGLLFVSLTIVEYNEINVVRLFEISQAVSNRVSHKQELYVGVGVLHSVHRNNGVDIGTRFLAEKSTRRFSGLLFLLEAPRHDIKFATPFDFIFFGVATMATVGYGDFSPITVFGRILCILFIVLCVTIGATQFKRLKLSVSDKTHKMGRGKFSEGYIFFWGSLSDWQLLSFCKCIHNTYESSISNVVVATPLPLKYYETVHMAVTQNTGIKLIIFGGSSTLYDPSYIAKLLFNSNYTVLVNDMDFNLLPNFNEYIINDDRRTILMALASINVSRQLRIPIAIQLHGSEYKSLLKNADMDNVFYNRELKYKMFSRSVACRGLFYLISSLFHTPTNINRTKIHVEEMCNLFLLSEGAQDFYENSKPSVSNTQHVEVSVFNVQNQMNELFRGMRFQIFKLQFPKSAHGVSFQEFANYLYSQKNMFLIGIVSSKNVCILNPVRYKIGDEVDDNFCGLVMAESLNDVIRVSLSKFNPEEYKSDEIRAMSSLKKARSISLLPSINEAVQPDKAPKYRGIYKVQNYTFAAQNILDDENLVLVCGWPYDMKTFISNLLDDKNYNIVILAPMESVEEEDPQSLEEYSNRVVYIDSTPMEVHSLVNAGILDAECLIIFNFHHTVDRGRRENLSRDYQVLFIHRLALEATKNGGRTGRKLNTILDVSHASCLEYMDPSLIVNVDVTSKNYAQNKCWENYGEFMSSYEIASGSIFVQDMFYAILAHSNTKSQYSVTHESIESLIKPEKIRLGSYTLEGGEIILERAAMSFYGKNFEDLFKYYFNVEKKICIGILRTYVMPFVTEESKEFVIVAPQPCLMIQPDDQIYMITKSRTV